MLGEFDIKEHDVIMGMCEKCLKTRPVMNYPTPVRPNPTLCMGWQSHYRCKPCQYEHFAVSIKIRRAEASQTENERLRSALKEIASFSRLEYVGLGELGSKLVRIALLALEAKP